MFLTLRTMWSLPEGFNLAIVVREQYGQHLNECGWIWRQGYGLPTRVQEPKTESSLTASSGEEKHNFAQFLVLYSPGILFAVCRPPPILKQLFTSSPAPRPRKLRSMEGICVLFPRSSCVGRFTCHHVEVWICGRVSPSGSKRRTPVRHCVLQDSSLLYSRTGF